MSHQWYLSEYVYFSHIDGLVQDCSISIVNTFEILQSCNKPYIICSNTIKKLNLTNNTDKQTMLLYVGQVSSQAVRVVVKSTHTGHLISLKPFSPISLKINKILFQDVAIYIDSIILVSKSFLRFSQSTAVSFVKYFRRICWLKKKKKICGQTRFCEISVQAGFWTAKKIWSCSGV